MSFSINTNVGAFVALQNLSKTSADLATTQNRINTGLAVSSAKDNTAVYAIAQNLRSSVGGLNAVKQSLDRAASALNVTSAATESISDLLVQAREKAVAAADTGLDANSRTSLNNDYKALQAQITGVAKQATFNGTNLIDGSGGSLSAITDPNNLASVIAVATSDLTSATLGLTAAGFATAAAANTEVGLIDTAIGTVNTQAGKYGSAAQQIERQRSFADKLSDTLQAGIGNLVDADLARESARLQSLQVKQQLGLQSLAIANQAPQAVISLFK